MPEHAPPQGPPGPPPPPSHPPVDYGAIMALVRVVMGKATPEGVVRPADLQAIATERGAPLSHVYAAMGMHPGLRLERTHPVAFGVCTGKCQMWGSFDLLDGLLAQAGAREAEGRSSFDVVPQSCLNLCDQPPAVVAASPGGVAGLPSCKAHDIEEAMAVLVDAEDPSGG